MTTMIEPPPYNPFDWYWVVGGDETKYWSSASSSYVLSLPNGAGLTRIDTEKNLADVLSDYGLTGPVPLVPKQVPMWAVRTVLQTNEIFDQAQTLVTASSNIALKNIWEYGNFADRNSEAINSLATALGLTSEQLDQMFIQANALIV